MPIFIGSFPSGRNVGKELYAEQKKSALRDGEFEKKKYIPNNVTSVIVTFAGSQSVAFLFKQLGYKTI